MTEPHFGICTWKCSLTYCCLERDQQTTKVIDFQLIQTIYVNNIIIPVIYYENKTYNGTKLLVTMQYTLNEHFHTNMYLHRK